MNKYLLLMAAILGLLVFLPTESQAQVTISVRPGYSNGYYSNGYYYQRQPTYYHHGYHRYHHYHAHYWHHND